MLKFQIACNWLGAIALVIAPFFIDTIPGKILASSGLFLLCFQAYRLKAWNLILLNVFGILGYVWSILT